MVSGWLWLDSWAFQAAAEGDLKAALVWAMCRLCVRSLALLQMCLSALLRWPQRAPGHVTHPSWWELWDCGFDQPLSSSTWWFPRPSQGSIVDRGTQDPDSTISFNHLGSCYLMYKVMLGSPFPGAPSSLTAVLRKSELLASENEPPASVDGRELEPRIKCCWSPGDWGKHLFTSSMTLQGLVGGSWIQSGSCPRASPHFWSKLFIY